ncbi:MAG: hypothetical protein ACX939_03030 [Hyphococcus sp.]
MSVSLDRILRICNAAYAAAEAEENDDTPGQHIEMVIVGFLLAHGGYMGVGADISRDDFDRIVEAISKAQEGCENVLTPPSL